jgi:gluconokinase
LRAAAPGLRFAWLELDPASARTRVADRPSHFFPAGLVATQFDTLEPPVGEDRVLRLDALQPPAALTERVARWLADDGAA